MKPTTPPTLAVSLLAGSAAIPSPETWWYIWSWLFPAWLWLSREDGLSVRLQRELTEAKKAVTLAER